MMGFQSSRSWSSPRRSRSVIATITFTRSQAKSKTSKKQSCTCTPKRIGNMIRKTMTRPRVSEVLLLLLLLFFICCFIYSDIVRKKRKNRFYRQKFEIKIRFAGFWWMARLDALSIDSHYTTFYICFLSSNRSIIKPNPIPSTASSIKHFYKKRGFCICVKDAVWQSMLEFCWIDFSVTFHF